MSRFNRFPSVDLSRLERPTTNAPTTRRHSSKLRYRPYPGSFKWLQVPSFSSLARLPPTRNRQQSRPFVRKLFKLCEPMRTTFCSATVSVFPIQEYDSTRVQRYIFVFFLFFFFFIQSRQFANSSSFPPRRTRRDRVTKSDPRVPIPLAKV